MPNPNYESQYRNPVYNRQTTNPAATFLMSFMSSLAPIMEYKWKQSMQEDAATKKLQMEREWKAEQESKQAAIDAADPLKKAQAEKTFAEASKSKLDLHEAEGYAAWKQKQPDNWRDMLYGKMSGVTPAFQAEQGLASLALPAIQGAVQGTADGNPVVRSGMEKVGMSPENALGALPMSEEEQSIADAQRELGIMQKGEDTATLDNYKTSNKRETDIKMQMLVGKSRQEAESIVDGRNANPESSKMEDILASTRAKRMAAIQDLVDSGMPQKKAEETVAAATISNYEKEAPREMPAYVLKGLAEIVRRGYPMPPAPNLGIGASGMPARIAYYKTFIDGILGGGDSAPADGIGEYGLNKADYKADTGSLNLQAKTKDSMQSFVKNMGMQVDRLNVITNDLGRTNVKLLNIPIRKLAMEVKGSAIEAKVNMYLTEISNEIGKLSTGSTASIRELSESAQEKWSKIHDPNLSIADLRELLKETKHAGDMRMQTVEETVDNIRGRIGSKRTPDKWDATLSPKSKASGAEDPLGIR